MLKKYDESIIIYIKVKKVNKEHLWVPLREEVNKNEI
jgi:hypothetical protein